VGAFDDLVAVVARLRSEGGCPWDRAQSWESLRPYVLEEAFEVVEAVDRNDPGDVRKELGDVLFQVVLLARIGEERGEFTVDDVARQIVGKMIDRHPHVFDPDHASTANEGSIGAWEARKSKERGSATSALDGVPDALPALLRAHRVSEKAATVGFDWPDVASVRTKVDEELRELDQALTSGDAAAIGEELGDLLFALVNLGRHLPVSAEDALRMATRKFERRFRAVEWRVHEAGHTVHDIGQAELEAHWQAVKEGGG
jgi:nucleoside triphosphate diphosphatase